MPAIAMGLIWGGYTVTVWGYCLVRGYNVTLAQLANPRTIYKWSARMPEIPQGMLLPGGHHHPVTSCAGGGTQYTYAQLEGLWVNAGGQASMAPLMAAIAEAESGGCSSALNATDNGGTQSSYGLWQISTGTHAAPSPDWS